MAQNQSVPAAFRDPVVVPGMELETAADIFEPNKIDVAKLAAEDIAIQRGEQEQNLRQDFDKLLNAQSNQEIEQLGITELGGTPISMNVLSAARENADLQGQLYASFLQQQGIAKQDPQKLAVPFSGPNYEEVRLPKVFNDLPVATRDEFARQIKNTQNLAKILNDESNIPVEVQQVILDNFKSGDFLDEFAESFRSIPSDFARLPTLGMAGIAAGNAVIDAMANDDTDLSFRDAFSQSYENTMRGAAKYLRPYEEWLNTGEASAIFKNAEQKFQERFKQDFVNKYGEDLYSIYFQEPEVKITYDENGEKQIEEVLNEDGSNKMKDVGLPAQMVNDIVFGSYDALTSAEKSIIFFGTQAPLSLLMTARGLSKGSIIEKQVDEARRNTPEIYIDKDGNPLSDYEVYKLLRKDQGNLVTRTFNRALSAITFGQAGKFFQAGNLARSRTFNDHLDTISRFEDDIARLSGKIDSGDLVGTKLDDAIKERDFLQNGLDNYVSSKGGKTLSKFINPYTKAVLADDIVISGAMGYAPAMLDWAGVELNDDVATAITSIAAPLIAPAVVRYSVGGSLKAVNALTDDTLKDVGMTLENSNYLPFITEGMLVRGDEGEMRRTLKEMGMEPTQGMVQSFNTLSKVFNNMTPEGRLRTYTSLRKYNQTLSNIQDRMMDLKDTNGVTVFTPQEVFENMSNLHLSLAHASGLAPLIYMQVHQGKNIKMLDLTRRGSLDSVFAAMSQEEQVYKGMDTLLNLFTRRLDQRGIQLDSNEPLQKLLVSIEDTVTRGKDNVNLKKQELDKLLTQFYLNAEELDENSINKIINLKTLLLPEEIRGQVDTAKMVAQVSLEIAEGARSDAIALRELSATMPEQVVLDKVRPIADKMFSTELGRRKALVSTEYKKVDDYRLADGSEVQIDMNLFVRKMMDTTEDLKGKPFSYLFGGGRQVFSETGGAAALSSFQTAAQRGLEAEFGVDEVNKLFKAADGVEEGDYVALALYMLPEPAKASDRAEVATYAFKFFEATTEEAEDIYRYFRDRAATLSQQQQNPKKNAGAIMAEFKGVVDDIYMEADPSGGYLTAVKSARSAHETLIGEVTDVGTYAGTVTKSQVRKNPKTLPEGEGLMTYKSVSARPEAPFVNISRHFQQIVSETDEVKISDLKTAIIKEKERIMYFFGASRVNGKPAFDLSDPKQRANADSMEQILDTLISKRMIAQFENDIEAATKVRSMLSGEDPITSRDAIIKVRESNATYDFSRAKRIQDVENELFTFPVIEPDGRFGERRMNPAAKVEGFAASIDDLLEKSQRARNQYNKNREELNNQSSTLRIGAQREVDKEDEIVTKMSRIEQLVERPESFFDTVFENATPESIQKLVTKFETQGMSRDDIKQGLKYMYVRGIFSKAGTKYTKTSGMNDATQEIGDVTTLIDYVNDPKKRAVMVEVLGKDAVEELDDIANWATTAIGDGQGFRVQANTKGMSIDSAIARTFNLARGMVSPVYVAAETGLRLMLTRNQNLLSLAISDRTAATIIAKILRKPKSVEPREIEILGQRIKNYLLVGENGILRSQGEIPTLDALLGKIGIEIETMPQPQIAEEEEERQREEIREMTQ